MGAASARVLGRRCVSTIRRIEGLDGPIGAHFETIEKILRAFDNAGLSFPAMFVFRRNRPPNPRKKPRPTLSILANAGEQVNTPSQITR
jgi:hypothetical protein